MRLYKIAGCNAIDFNIVGNLQFELKSTKSTISRSLKLARLGPELPSSAECWTFTLGENEKVASMEISYLKQYIEYVAITLTSGRFTQWGAK